jgi:hypothetical protein
MDLKTKLILQRLDALDEQTGGLQKLLQEHHDNWANEQKLAWNQWRTQRENELKKLEDKLIEAIGLGQETFEKMIQEHMATVQAKLTTLESSFADKLDSIIIESDKRDSALEKRVSTLEESSDKFEKLNDKLKAELEETRQSLLNSQSAWTKNEEVCVA